MKGKRLNAARHRVVAVGSVPLGGHKPARLLGQWAPPLPEGTTPALAEGKYTTVGGRGAS